MAEVVLSFDETHLERICMILADTSSGLTGFEIGRILSQLEILDETRLQRSGNGCSLRSAIASEQTAVETTSLSSSMR